MRTKKNEILEKSADTFRKLGIRAVSMDDLARNLGMSKKTIYKYFVDKDELVKEIIIEKTEADKKICENARENSVNAIDEMVRICEFISEMFNDLHSSVFYDLQKYHHGAWEIMECHKNEFVRNQIRSNVIRGIYEGIYRPNLNPEIISRAYIATMSSLFDSSNLITSGINFSTALNQVIRFQIRGLANENGLDYLKKRLKQDE